MNYEILHSPSFSTLEFDFEEGDGIMAQPNTMVGMTSGIDITAKAGANVGSRGLFGGVKGLVSGESFFTTVFRAKENGQRLSLAPPAIGEIIELDLEEEGSYLLTRGAYLASMNSVDMKLKYGGFKGVLAKKGLFLLHASGVGSVFCASYGQVVVKDIAEGERFVVDNRYVIAFSDTIKYELVKATKKLSHSFMSGEGLVNRYTGPGRLYYQTRAKQVIGFFGRLFQAAT